MDLAQFVSMLHRMQLFFIKANKLRDPYEGTIPQFNNLMRSEVYATEKHKFQSEDQFNHFISTMPDTMRNQFQAYRELVLINSWHYNEYESAAMWHLYSQENAGIAIQSTVGRLCESFSSNREDTIWIGKVDYLDYNKDWMNERNLFEGFVIKRKSFEYENEVRAVTCLPDDHLGGERVLSDTDKERERVSPTKPRIINRRDLTDKGKYVSADLKILTENIYIAPYSEPWFKEVVESLLSKYGLDAEVIKSDLYTIS